MTGEITLRGLVLPIGGLKEKTLAAKRAGIKEVVVPKRNEKDMPDIPEEVRNTVKFHFVENVDDVLAVALAEDTRRKPAAAAPPRTARRGAEPERGRKAEPPPKPRRRAAGAGR